MTSILVLLQLAGAVALLLFSLGLLRDGMVEAFGLRLKMILGFGTKRGPRAFISGLAATLGLQSSTATALLTASFVDRGMIAPRMAQVVLLGANVGTALTAVVVSAGIDALAPALILLGYVLRKRKGALQSGLGAALVGAGLMLVSLTLLEHATGPLRGSERLAAFLPMLDDARPVALVLAAGVAMACSSSLAAVLLFAALPLSPELMVIMVLGANLGGAASALLASAALGSAARRVTLGNLLVRAFGCLLAAPCVPWIVAGLALLPTHLGGLAVEAHLAFNLILAAVIWPFISLVSGLADRLVPDDEPQSDAATTTLLDEAALATPLLALSGASREVLSIGDNVERMLDQTRTAFRKTDAAPLAEVSALEERVDRRQQEVKTYLSRLGGEVSEKDRRSAIGILGYVINLEHIGDIIDKGLAPEVRKKIGLGLRFSDEGYKELDTLFLMTQENLRMAQTVLTGDPAMARRLMEVKDEVRSFERQSAQRHLIRLRDGQVESRETSSLHLDLLRDLKRINAHAVSVAHPILDEEGMLIESRLRAH